MLRKLLIVIIALLAGLWFVRKQARRLRQEREGPSSTPATPKPHREQNAALPMVECVQCGAYFAATATQGGVRCAQCMQQH